MPDWMPFATGALARSPRGAVRLNGMVMAGWESWEVESNAYCAADSFAVSFAAAQLPHGCGPDWFGAQVAIAAEIFASADPVDPGGYQPVLTDRLISGQVDDIAFDPLRGTLVLTGRDKTALLIDTMVSSGYLNQTSSQIAAVLAENHGLTPVVSETTAPVGTFYSQNHISLTQQRSEWDILTELAGFENFDAFVLGDELHFEPRPDPAAAGRYVIDWRQPGPGTAAPAANVAALRFERSLTLARGVSVTVQSWHARQGKRFAATWPKPDRDAAAPEISPLAYSFIAPGLTQDQCQQLALARYREIARHEVRLSAEMPGDDLLDCRTIVAVQGTDTPWDQDYFPDAVRRTMSAAGGYRMTLNAKNIGA
jgi:phage protein D